jgi:hypothetical protein
MENGMVRSAGAIVLFTACMAASSALADCASGVIPERLSCLNQELATLRAESSREIASLRADIQMLRNQVLSLRQTVESLPPPADIPRLDEDLNVLWEPQDGCLTWTGPELDAPAPTGGGAMAVFAPCGKAPSRNSVLWRLRRAPVPR